MAGEAEVGWVGRLFAQSGLGGGVSGFRRSCLREGTPYLPCTLTAVPYSDLFLISQPTFVTGIFVDGSDT